MLSGLGVRVPMGLGLARCCQRSPFHDVEAGDAVLPPHGIQEAAEHGHAHAGAAGAGGRHVAAPLIGLGVVSGGSRK